MQPTADTASELAHSLFGVGGQAEPLPGELDHNFRIRGDDGRDHVLKLRPDTLDPEGMALQDAVLRHLDGLGGVPRLEGGPLPAGDGCTARLLSWLDGEEWARSGPWEPALVRDLGGAVARLDRALAAFSHPAAGRPLRWDMGRAGELWPALDLVEPRLRPFAETTMERFAALRGRLGALPVQVIHNDANEHNVLVGRNRRVAGLIDFGDVVVGPRVCGLAVACAYAGLGRGDPVTAAAQVTAGYHREAPVYPEELELLHDLLRTRLAMSICMAALQRREQPHNAYIEISQTAVAEAALLLDAESDELAHFRYRDACGYAASPSARAVIAFLESDAARPAPVCDVERAAPLHWEIGGATSNAFVAGGVAVGAEAIEQELAAAGARVGVGGYRVRRDVYRGDGYETQAAEERRCIHMAIDIWAPAGEPVHVPFAGTIEAVERRDADYDFGPVVIVRHETPDRTPFWTLYGHLSVESTAGLQPGAALEAGALLARTGPFPENGNWPPHVHFQLLTSLLGMGTGLHGVAAPSQLDVWQSVCPDPNLILRVPGLAPGEVEQSREPLLARRTASLSAVLSLAYAEPLEIVRGEGAHLFDAEGAAYLDLVNNVCHVGHCHPRVVAAIAGQAAQLNTNTRYLHPLIGEYARRLTGLLPDPLSVVFFVNSGSEANDLALRLARAHTGGNDLLVLDWAYHGNLGGLIEASPYKFDRPGGRGAPPHVHVCELADPYRGRFGGDGPAYAQDVAARIAELAAAGHAPAALIAESLPGCAGQVELAPGYLDAAYAHVRAAGGLCIADEVQTGFGRMGSHFWGFETQGVVPDVVTLGKPIGNGHPLGAVVTTPWVARSFVTGMEYFNTYGGNPVSCAAGLAVLDVIRDERLVAHAERLGGRLRAGLEQLAGTHPLIGDVRGRGLYLGVDLVRDRAGREPATAEAAAVKEAMVGRRILISTDGPFDNVLKIKPPLALDEADCDNALAALDAALTDVEADG